ncbi:SCO2322 family protein [Streptomyces sp. S.PNR 29]|uniref:SCO2322 family protein n=1 Tax=Streptomyces sp. S.PNR 29 TaxID=2973805 RepID=UPI0025B141D0|nr:SCO2322 family protein [Streptomyces sp. S.PNR 29]MDN0194535.1 SCO2322 family protein [Streptomyces sp. S.PNR 29]
MTTRRAAALLLSAFLLLSGTGQARAADYRYWSFWERDGDHWTYATQGPSATRPADGDVQGFRFALSENSADATRPRGTASFASICARTPTRDGSKRVALVLDFGTTADAPPGETPPRGRTACAVIPRDATTAQALAAVAKPLRYDTNALLCSIAGYPRKGCGEQVTEVESKPEGNAGDGPSVGLLTGIGVVAVLGGAAVWQARRRA